MVLHLVIAIERRVSTGAAIELWISFSRTLKRYSAFELELAASLPVLVVDCRTPGLAHFVPLVVMMALCH